MQAYHGLLSVWYGLCKWNWNDITVRCLTLIRLWRDLYSPRETKNHYWVDFGISIVSSEVIRQSNKMLWKQKQKWNEKSFSALCFGHMHYAKEGEEKAGHVSIFGRSMPNPHPFTISPKFDFDLSSIYPFLFDKRATECQFDYSSRTASREEKLNRPHAYEFQECLAFSLRLSLTDCWKAYKSYIIFRENS